MKHIFLYFLFVPTFLFSQIVINEVSSSGNVSFPDEDGDIEDWIEMYNTSNSPIDLFGYKIQCTEGTKTNSWTFPHIIIKPHDFITVFCSEKNRKDYFHHWEVPIHPQLPWKYYIGFTNPPATWKNVGFNDTPWLTGQASIGYGDNDDATIIPQTMSVFMRYSFNIADTSKIITAALLLDYDDGIVAYFNGIEIGRRNVGAPGDNTPNTASAFDEHEATVYQTGNISDGFFISKQMLDSIKRPGINTFAIQTHNYSSGLDDLTILPYFLIGVNDTVATYYQFPADIHLHTDFNLSSNGQTLVLKDALGNIIDQATIGNIVMDDSRGRKPDGSNNWCLFDISTPDTTNNTSACFSGYAADPTITLQSGFYQNTQTTGITSTTAGTIRYTTNGGEPNNFSPIYTTPITIGSNKVIRAKVFPSNINLLPSRTITNSYFINENITLSVVSLTSDPYNLFDYNYGIYRFGPFADSVNVPFYGSNFWMEWTRPANVEYFDKNKNFCFETESAIKIQGNWSKAWPQKGFTVKAKDNFGGNDINYTLFPEKPHITKYKSFNIRNAGSDWNSGHLRDRFNQMTARKTHIDIMDGKPAVLFINGVYWGVYELRERQDKNYIASNFGVDADKIDLLSFDGNVIEGSNKGFTDMVQFAYLNNMSSNANYTTMKSLLDIENFCDYFILETYIINIDWIGTYTNNIKYWRTNNPVGKWRYMLWDTDVSLGLAASFNGADTTNMIRLAINPPVVNPHSIILKSLLDNPEFKEYFINRYADLLNTVLLSQNRITLLHQLRDEMMPEMSRHFQRWGNQFTWFNLIGQANNVPQWMNELAEIEQFENSRIVYSRNHIKNQFNLVKQVNLTLKTYPENAGTIHINSITPDSLPWTGVYFDGNPVTVTATANAGYKFSHWQSIHVQTNPYTQNTLRTNFNTNDTLIAYFEPLDLNINAYPNPFNDEITIMIELPNDAQVDLALYNTLGQKIAQLLSPTKYTAAGQHQIKYSEADNSLQAGVYFVKFTTGDFSKTIKILKTDK